MPKSLDTMSKEAQEIEDELIEMIKKLDKYEQRKVIEFIDEHFSNLVVYRPIKE